METTKTATVKFYGKEFEIYRTDATAEYEGHETHIWIDGDEFANLFIEDGEGGFIELDGSNDWKLSEKSGDHYMFVLSEDKSVSFIDMTPKGYQVNGGETHEHLSDAMGAARRPQSARNRATSKYRKGNVRQVIVRLYPGDADVAEHLDSIDEPRATYIKRLIREDMERR